MKTLLISFWVAACSAAFGATNVVVSPLFTVTVGQPLSFAPYGLFGPGVPVTYIMMRASSYGGSWTARDGAGNLLWTAGGGKGMSSSDSFWSSNIVISNSAPNQTCFFVGSWVENNSTSIGPVTNSTPSVTNIISYSLGEDDFAVKWYLATRVLIVVLCLIFGGLVFVSFKLGRKP